MGCGDCATAREHVEQKHSADGEQHEEQDAPRPLPAKR
jgi:hypothetical protein